jgi:hypothetical protein
MILVTEVYKESVQVKVSYTTETNCACDFTVYVANIRRGRGGVRNLSSLLPLPTESKTAILLPLP